MIHVEKGALNSFLANNMIKNNINFNVIDSIDEVADDKSEIILKPKKDTYCHPCPATKTYNCCNYHTMDVMEGCPFDCSYCILQAYLPHKNIQVSSDTDTILDTIKSVIKAGVKRRAGTGELSDSLALDNIFPFTELITPLINNQDVIQFEFKTKSVNIANLLNLNPKNIITSWSINPQYIVEHEEPGAAKVSARIQAAKKCAEYGYKIGFHFDPVVYCDNYKKLYSDVIGEILENIPEKSIEFISISTFRGPMALIDRMRERPLVPNILQGDFIQGLDGKQRYFKPLRMEMIKFIADCFRKEWINAFLYLCMEHTSVWEYALNIKAGNREETEQLFPWYQ